MTNRKPATEESRRRSRNEPTPYRLRFLGGVRHDRVEAVLRSPLLDTVLYPQRIAHILLAAKAPRAGARKPVLGAFVVRSLEEYLRMQVPIRAVLQEELLRERGKRDKRKQVGDEDVWKQSKVVIVSFDKRYVPSRGELELFRDVFHVPRKMLEAWQKARRPDKRSNSTVVVEVPWAGDHRFWLFKFRDGEFDSVWSE